MAQKGKPQPPRPFFLAHSIEDGALVVHAFTRNTMDLVKAMQEHPGALVVPLVAPPGPARKKAGE